MQASWWKGLSFLIDTGCITYFDKLLPAKLFCKQAISNVMYQMLKIFCSYIHEEDIISKVHRQKAETHQWIYCSGKFVLPVEIIIACNTVITSRLFILLHTLGICLL